MKKIYEKPDAEYISLIVEEEVTLIDGRSGGWIDGEIGTSDSIF